MNEVYFEPAKSRAMMELEAKRLRMMKLDYRKRAHLVEWIKQRTDVDYANVLKEVNVLIKRTNESGKDVFYSWIEAKKLWGQSEADTLSNISFQLSFVAQEMRTQLVLKQEIYSKIMYDVRVTRTLKNIKRVMDLECDEEFLVKLNAPSEIIPIKDGKKINVRTKQVTERGLSDYYTRVIPSTYISDLDDTRNVFAQFCRDIWPDEEEYNFFRMLNGKLILPDMHNNNIVMWQHNEGGGGKTVWIKSLQIALGDGLCKEINKYVFLGSRTANSSFELKKMLGKTIVYVDEVANKEQDKKDVINIATLCKLSGGGTLNDAGKHQRNDVVRTQKNTATIVFLGNFHFFKDKITKAVLRRMIYMRSIPFWRAITDGSYDEDNPDCHVMDENLWNKIENNIDHVLTYLVNAAHDYLNSSSLNLQANQPIRFKQEWKEIVDNNNDSSINIVKAFIDEECLNRSGVRIKLSEFVNKLNMWNNTKHCNNPVNKFTNNSIRNLVKDVSIGNPKIYRTMERNSSTAQDVLVHIRWKSKIEKLIR